MQRGWETRGCWRVGLAPVAEQMVSGYGQPCFGGHGPERGQSPPLSQLQQIVGSADDAPFCTHIFQAP